MERHPRQEDEYTLYGSHGATVSAIQDSEIRDPSSGNSPEGRYSWARPPLGKESKTIHIATGANPPGSHQVHHVSTELENDTARDFATDSTACKDILSDAPIQHNRAEGKTTSRNMDPPAGLPLPLPLSS